MTDFLTVLTCTPGHRCAKLYTAPSQKKPEPYNAGFLFGVEQVPVASLAELAEALDGLRAMPDAMVIRDRLRPGAKPAPNGLFARRRVDRPNDPAPFEAAEHSWAMFDADTTAGPFDPTDPVGSVERWKEKLPIALRTAAGIFQFSASQHLSANVRGHLWVWLAEPLGGVPLARWSSRNGLDPAVFHAVQPLYTADPIFAEGTRDPLASDANGRALVKLEGNEAVELDLTEQDHIEGALLSQNGQRRLGSIHLAEVGEPSPEPDAIDSRRRVIAQLSSAFAGPGKRWDLCGHVGGACANAGAPPEECCAILEGLRTADVPNHAFAAGLQWALGAYSFSARPMGLKGIALLCGPVVSIKVGDALRALGEIYREPTPEEEAVVNAPVLSAPDWGGLPFDAFSSDEEPEAIPYIIPALNLGPGKPSAIVGYAYSSKTPFALELAVCVASGAAEFQGHTIAYSTSVLYIATEGARNARRKAARIAIAHGTTLAKIGARLVIVQAPPGFLNVESAELIGGQAEAGGFGLVLIDTYNSAFDGSKDRNSSEFSLALSVLGDISDRVQVTFVALLHCRKGTKDTKGRAPALQEIDGHNSVAGAVQCAIGLWRPDPTQKLLIGVECVRAVDDGFEPYCIEWRDTPCVGSAMLGLRSEIAEMVEGEGSPVMRADKETLDRGRIRTKTLALLAVRGDRGMTGRDLDRAGMGGASVSLKSRVRAEMCESGEIVEIAHEYDGLVYKTAPRSPKSAEALAKHAGTGFLASGRPKGQKEK